MEKLEISEELTNTVKWMYKMTKFQVGEEEIDIGSGVL